MKQVVLMLLIMVVIDHFNRTLTIMCGENDNCKYYLVLVFSLTY